MKWFSKRSVRKDEVNAAILEELRALRATVSENNLLLAEHLEQTKMLRRIAESSNRSLRDVLIQICVALLPLALTGISLSWLWLQIRHGLDWSSWETYLSIVTVVWTLIAVVRFFVDLRKFKLAPKKIELPPYLAGALLGAYFQMLLPVAILLPVWLEGTRWSVRLEAFSTLITVFASIGIVYFGIRYCIRRVHGHKPVRPEIDHFRGLPTDLFSYLTSREELLGMLLMEVLVVGSFMNPVINPFTS